MSKRAIILIIDACGIGSLPDWADYDEQAESNTLLSTCKYAAEHMGGIKLPNLQQLGLANIIELPGLAAMEQSIGSYGKMAELNDAKDTITGHWEMVGIKAVKPFQYYYEGFPDEIVEEIKKQFGVDGILCNATASGTEVINDLGDEHARTGYPIVYTSADSVLQIAANVEIVDLKTQYHWCELAREIMRDDWEVARIIARPFCTNPDYMGDEEYQRRVKDGVEVKAAERKYIRLNDKRHDYSILPHGRSVLETVMEQGGEVIGFGKIRDIFAGVGVSDNIHTSSNADGLDKLINYMREPATKDQVLFINLVETDANFGHRRDPQGFATALEAIDKRMPELLAAMTDEDVLFVSADHGCDPTAVGSDHTREYVPILVYSKSLVAQDLGTRESFADIGASILKHFRLEDPQVAIQGEAML